MIIKLDYLDVDWDFVQEIEKDDMNYSTQKLFSKINATMNKHVPIRKLSTKVLEQNESQPSNPNKWKEQPIQTNPSGCKTHTTAHNEITFLTLKSKKEYYLKYFDKHDSTLKIM